MAIPTVRQERTMPMSGDDGYEDDDGYFDEEFEEGDRYLVEDYDRPQEPSWLQR